MKKQSKVLRKNKQVESLTSALETEKNLSKELQTRIRYLQADIENLNKRFTRQIDELKKYCTERIILDLINAIEELNLAIDSSRPSEKTNSLIEGVKMTVKKLEKILENEGVSPINSMDQPFDPVKHQAISQLNVDDVDDCVVIEEIRKGYIMKEKIIRPSVVRISTKESSKPEQGDN